MVAAVLIQFHVGLGFEQSSLARGDVSLAQAGGAQSVT